MLDMLTATEHHHPHAPHAQPRRSPSPGATFLQMPLSLFNSVLRKQPAADATAELPTQSPEVATTNKPTNLMTDLSRPTTASTATSAEEKPKKKTVRPKTIYNLALPPPTKNQKKFSIRPKVLLQLHQVVASRRPKPVYEVTPYSVLDTSRRLAPTFQIRKLCPTDILIIRTEGYEQSAGANSEDEPWAGRDVVAVICPAKEERAHGAKAELLLDNGQTWDVTPTNNGGYEFNFVDGHGLALKSRWVPKAGHSRRHSISAASAVAGFEDRKFKFSTISAHSRRHPVIASLSRSRIEINDSYVVPCATSPPTPSQAGSPITTPSTVDLDSFMDDKADELPVTTDEALRSFITISGVWVAFCENWSPAYSNATSFCSSSMASNTRAVSMPIEQPRSASPAPTINDQKRTLPSIIRSSTLILQRNSSASDAALDLQSPATSPTNSRPRRSNSTGTADLVRSGSAKMRFGLEDQILESEEERQVKRSTEILRIKEMALSPTLNVFPIHTLTPIPSADPTPTRSTSPASFDGKGRQTRSTYDPIPTAGLWDSGVVEGGGLKTRPTSMVVLNEKKMKAKKKALRSRSKDQIKEKKEKKDKKDKKEKKEKNADGCRKSDSIRNLFSIFRKEKKPQA